MHLELINNDDTNSYYNSLSIYTIELTATGAVDEAIILGKGDGVTWASTPGFVPQEYKTTIENEDGTEVEINVKESEGLVKYGTTLQRPVYGIRMGNVKYMPVRSFPKGQLEDGMPTVYLKKPKGGACMVVTQRSIIIATFDENKSQTAANCNGAVEALGRYLCSAGF